MMMNGDVVVMMDSHVVVMMVMMMHRLHRGSGSRGGGRSSVVSESERGSKHERRAEADRRKGLNHKTFSMFRPEAQSVLGWRLYGESKMNC
jgi:hypothetical protein